MTADISISKYCILVVAWVTLYPLALAFPQANTAKDHQVELHQNLIDLNSYLSVLSITLEPGYEDFSSLAYLRFSRGAKIASAYITNGEASVAGSGEEYPMDLAARRRREAFQAMSALGGEVFFLNVPDFGAASDSSRVRMYWPSDTLEARLMRIIADFKPDLILLSSDRRAAGEKSIRTDIVRADLLGAVRQLASGQRGASRLGVQILDPWVVERIIEDQGSMGQLLFPIDQKHPLLGKSFGEIGAEVGRHYDSIHRGIQSAGEAQRSAYTIVYSARVPSVRAAAQTRRIDDGIPARVSVLLRSTEKEIGKLAASLLKSVSARKPKSSVNWSGIRKVVSLMDSVDYHIRSYPMLQPADQKALLRWKEGLENLRNALLGVRVVYRMSDTVLVPRQLTYLQIDTILGASAKGTTDLFVPAVDQGWLLNEAPAKRIPLNVPEIFRLISPPLVQYDLPAASNGLEVERYGTSLLFFVVHQSESRERSFVCRVSQRIFYAPKFTTEVLTPLVRIVPGERLAVRLTNHTRDGVADVVEIKDSLAQASPRPFRLSTKESSHVDTLEIMWSDGIPDGSYLLPVQIGGVHVGNFAARKFESRVDTTKKVGVISAFEKNLLTRTLLRLAIRPATVVLDESFPEVTSSLDVIVVDERALSLRDDLPQFKDKLLHFAQRGGHVIVLAQDAWAWNRYPLWDGLQLKSTMVFDEQTEVDADSAHPILTSPNVLSEDDWENWLYYRAYNFVSRGLPAGAAAPVRSQSDGDPLLITLSAGKGNVTYVSLALHHQLLNVHPGAFRLLANLISY